MARKCLVIDANPHIRRLVRINMQRAGWEIWAVPNV